MLQRIALTSSASGAGKTTLGRELASRLDLPFVEVDALAHGPGWVEADAATLRALVEPIVATDRWVIDGLYRGKLGTLIPEHADVVVWLDQPITVSLPRLIGRTVRQAIRGEELWNGNRAGWRRSFGGRGSLIGSQIAMHRSRRRRYPAILAPFPLVRLRSDGEVAAWLDQVAPDPSRARSAARSSG